MPSIGNIDNKIAATPLQTNKNPQEKSKTQEQNKEKISSKTVMILSGASALASIAIACIAISRGKKVPAKSTAVVNGATDTAAASASKFPTVKPYTIELPPEEKKIPKIIDKILAYDEKETKIIKDISDLFKRYRDGEDIPEFRYPPSSVVFTFPKPIKPDIRRISPDDMKDVFAFVKNPQYNAKLSTGADVSDIKEISVMRKLINEALPIENEAYVYTGIRTQKVWDDFKPMEFVEDIETGNIIKDKSFIVTSRSYDEYLAQLDPYNLGKEHYDCGYILRIRLPKGTKGFDFRRCSRKDAEYGVNALYVLPENSEFKIRHIDDDARIIDCDYILPIV